MTSLKEILTGNFISSHPCWGAIVGAPQYQGYAKKAYPWLISEHASGVRAPFRGAIHIHASSSGSGVFRPSKNLSNNAPTPPPTKNHWTLPTIYVIATVIATRPGGLTPARSRPASKPMITSIGAVSKIVISLQKFERLKRYIPNAVVLPASI